MKIKTTEEIGIEYSEMVTKYYIEQGIEPKDLKHKVKWVAVDDIKEFIRECLSIDNIKHEMDDLIEWIENN